MADMNHKDDVVATETEEIMVDNVEPAPITPQSKYFSNNHFEDQNGVANKNESEMVEMAEHHVPTIQPNGQMVDDVIVDIEAMLLAREEHPLSSTCCIYRVPHSTRELNKEAYIPKVVSIGPFHYGNSRLQNMERHKQILFKQFIDKAETSLNDLVSFVKISEPKVRACYSENIKLTKKELVKVILVDAGFIIELFRKCYEKDLTPVDYANLTKPWLLDSIVLDLFLLENQLPFFILEELFNRAFYPHLRGYLPSFLELTFDMFSYYNKQNLKLNPNFRIKHFTDLLRNFHLQKKKPPRQSFDEAGSHVLFYSANELHEAGVKFKTNTNKCLLDLKFSKRVLEIPQILVEDRTETLFRNMIALEQCHYPFQSYITDYALLLDCLINTSKDVDVLVHKEIICNYLADSNDVAKLFNGLWKNITQVNFNSDYLDTCKRLNSFYKNPWHKKKATLRSDYCKTPWQTTASIAAIFLIILSLVQAICSVLQVSH